MVERDPAHPGRKPSESITRLAPEPVQRLIDLANLVPPSVELPSPRDFEAETLYGPQPQATPMPPRLEAARKAAAGGDPKRKAAYQRLAGEFFKKEQEPLAQSVKVWLERRFVGDEFAGMRRYLGEIDRDTVAFIFGNYSRLVASHAAIRELVQSGGEPNRPVIFQPPDQFFPVLLPVGATVDSKGRLRFGRDEIREALEGIEAHRLKGCPVCGRFFWAFRRDQPCCSERCANTRRVRKFREKYLKVYKPRRLGVP